jgi:hypothetical protein
MSVRRGKGDQVGDRVAGKAAYNVQTTNIISQQQHFVAQVMFLVNIIYTFVFLLPAS